MLSILIHPKSSPLNTIVHTPIVYFLPPLSYNVHTHTYTRHHITILQIWSGISFSKCDSSIFAHLCRPIPFRSDLSYSSFFNLNSFFLLFNYIIHTCILLQYSCFTINMYLPQLWPSFNTTNFNLFKTWITYVRLQFVPVQSSNIWCTSIDSIKQPPCIFVLIFINYKSLFSICLVLNPLCENSVLCYSWWHT